MAVVASKRTESELTLLTNARELASYTIKICSNEKNFPKRYRWCITSKIVDAAISINSNILKANSTYVKEKEDYHLRKQYQVKALVETYELLCLMDIAYNTFSIDGNRMKYWVGLVRGVQNALRKWRKSDEQRFK